MMTTDIIMITIKSITILRLISPMIAVLERTMMIKQMLTIIVKSKASIKVSKISQINDSPKSQQRNMKIKKIWAIRTIMKKRTV